MVLTPEYIIKLLEKRYPSLIFLQNREVTSIRFREKHVILFRYFHQEKWRVVKFYSVQHLDEDTKRSELENISEEFEISRSFISHPNFIHTYSFFTLTCNDETIGMCIESEYFETTLDVYLKNKKKHHNTEVISFLKQMGNALGYMHYRKNIPIVHADIKPGNIGLRFKNKQVVYALMDFDISVRLNRFSIRENINFSISNKAPFRGLTPQYAAPEQIAASMSGSGAISNRVDIYAIGAIALEMMTGIAPYKKEKDLLFQLPILKVTDQSWQQLFKNLIHANPAKRARKIPGISLTGLSKPAFLPLSIKWNLVTYLYASLIAIVSMVTILVIVLVSQPANKPEAKVEMPVNLNDSLFKKPPEPDYIIMPDVIGYYPFYAFHVLEESELEIGKISFVKLEPEYKNFVGRVVYTSYTSGYYVKKSTSIDIYIGE